MLRRVFHFETYRTPQFIAAALLLVYLLQCLWLVHAQSFQEPSADSGRSLRSVQGLEQWRGGPIAGTPESLRSETITGLPAAARAGTLRVRDGFDQDRSPLYYLLGAAPLLLRPDSWLPPRLLPFLAAIPSLFFGVMLGASLWYVARRLYGNAGGYIALCLYCFSPAMILNVAGLQSLAEMGAVWGAFGTIFTAIAVAHTLYAPREVVLWNWRRILLLGLSLTLAAANQFSLGILALVILPVMLWVAPVRPRSVLVIWMTSLALAAAFFLLAYELNVAMFWRGILHARWIDFEPAAWTAALSYSNAARTLIAGSPPLMLLFPAALIAWAAWKRARYFGTTAPLLIALLILTLAIGAPGFPGQGFHLTLLVFLFVFVSGVFADLLESKAGFFTAACLAGVLSAAALWNVVQLARL
jgi:hypothetical protein